MSENITSDHSRLSDSQKRELDKRYADYQNGIGKTFTWEETIAFMDKALNKRRGKSKD